MGPNGPRYAFFLILILVFSCLQVTSEGNNEMSLKLLSNPYTFEKIEGYDVLQITIIISEDIKIRKCCYFIKKKEFNEKEKQKIKRLIIELLKMEYYKNNKDKRIEDPPKKKKKSNRSSSKFC